MARSVSSRRRLAAAASLRGFTLVEVMIVATLAGVLGALALPSYLSSMLKARRSDGLVALMQAQLAQERFRADNPSYGTLGQIGQASLSSLGHYSLRVVSASPAGYAIVASANGMQARDDACRHLRLAVDGAALVYASGADESTSNPAPLNRRCWNQ